MKTHFLLMLTFFMVVVSSCRTNLVDSQVSLLKELSVDEARDWYLKTYAAGLRRGASPNDVQRIVPWKQTQIFKKGNSNYIYTPVLYGDRKKLAVGILGEGKNKASKEDLVIAEEGIVVFKNQKGENEARLLQFLPNDSKGIKKGNKPKDLKKFDGWVFICDVMGNLKAGVEYKNGKVERSFDVEQPKQARVQSCIQVPIVYQTVEVSGCGTNCVDVTVILHTTTGMVCTYSGSNLQPGNYNIMDAIGGGSGGGVPIEPAQSIIEIDYSALEAYPCIEELLKDGLQKNLQGPKSRAAQWIEDYFGGGVTQAQMKFLVDESMPFPAATIRSQFSPSGKTEIRFKPNEMLNFSKEYGIAIILHEFMHVKYGVHDPFAIAFPAGTQLEHREMLAKDLQELADALQSITGISQFDARAITINGLADVKNSDPAYFDSNVKNAYGADFDVNQALSHGAKYGYNRTLGANPCN
ncbi:hypothetical protein [Runella sp. SP2]|uniref:hypothetical protein n=1 Tax=Runella sp. SP2 TaxID=2268026 RepID=UPI000F084F18|nr:hypothetical protein [Runella sp. SP2]AYQ34177.1 hypothetical protein DTQ70_19345 [Runella sp. SP2]